MPGFTLKPGPGLDLSQDPSWSRPTAPPARKAAPARPAATFPTPPTGEVLFCEIDPDGLPDRAVRVAAEAAAHIGSRELGLSTPRVRWFQKVSPGLLEYRQKYWPNVSLRSWSGHPGEVGSTGPGRVGNEIWLRSDLGISEAILTSRHEIWHRYEFVVGEQYPEEVAERFGHGQLEFEDVA